MTVFINSFHFICPVTKTKLIFGGKLTKGISFGKLLNGLNKSIDNVMVNKIKVQAYIFLADLHEEILDLSIQSGVLQLVTNALPGKYADSLFEDKIVLNKLRAEKEIKK